MRQLFLILAAFCLLLSLEAQASQASTLDRVEAVVVTSPAGGVRLNGTLRLPTGPGPFPAAVLLPEHGAGTLAPTAADTQLLTNLTDYLVSQGIAVLRLQERDPNSSTTTTLAERTADATAALNYLRTHSQVDVAHLGLIGHGEGANVALLAGAQPLAPSFVVALAATGLPGRELLATQLAMYGKVLHDSTAAQHQRSYQLAQQETEQQAASMRAKGSNAAQVQMYLDQQHLRLKATMRHNEESLVKHQRAMLEIVRQTPDNAQAQAILSNMLRQYYPAVTATDVQNTVQLLTSPTYRSYLNFDPQSTLAQVNCPVLLLQGDNDTEVNPSVNLPLLRKGLRHNGQVAELRFPGLNHALQFTASAADAAPSPIAASDIRVWILGQKK